MTAFSYAEMTTRNRGFVTEAEQERLREAHVLIPGVGGMGGAAFMALLRAGVGNFIIADLDGFDLGANSWDCIVSVFCHLPPALRRTVHSAVPVALAAGGCFVFEAYRAANIGRGVGGPQNAEMTVELEDVLADLGAASGLEIVIGREVERDIVEGRYHNGRSATTQVLAKKVG